MLQEMWMWMADLILGDRLPERMIMKVTDWFHELSDLNEIKVQRCLQLSQEHEVVSRSLHTFVDASQEAYGACAYARYVYSDRHFLY